MTEYINRDDVINVIRNTISSGGLQDTLELRINSLDSLVIDTTRGGCPHLMVVERGENK